jgi:hypothetical protein
MNHKPRRRSVYYTALNYTAGAVFASSPTRKPYSKKPGIFVPVAEFDASFKKICEHSGDARLKHRHANRGSTIIDTLGLPETFPQTLLLPHGGLNGHLFNTEEMASTMPGKKSAPH